ncbi:MAG TPA: hypothetical protein VD794_09330 [Flavisolibacter sp.]|nr:hypothetical protein [Flavisolibacter sp.]
MKHLFLILFILNVTLCTGLFYFVPDLRVSLQSEDRLVENITALFFLLSAVLSLYYLVTNKSRFLRKLCTFVALLGGVAFLDEMSFGERAFNLSMPFIGSQKIDAIHDIIKLCFSITLQMLKRLPLPVLALSVTVVGGVMYLMFNRHKKRLYAMTYNIAQTEPYFFLRASIILLMAATFIDFDLFQHETLFLLEELFEMNAALALVFCCINLVWIKVLRPGRDSPVAKREDAAQTNVILASSKDGLETLKPTQIHK